MQLYTFTIFTILSIVLSTYCAPTDPVETNIDEEISHLAIVAHEIDVLGVEKKKLDYYEYRHLVAESVQRALNECREKFKWDRWNCPKKAFLDILNRIALPSSKEFGYVRALVASSMVLSLAKSCSSGANGVCSCNQPASLGSLGPLPSVEYPGSDRSDPNSDRTKELSPSKFTWRGCEEIVKFSFKVSEVYLEAQETNQDEASREINKHNYEVGRVAVKKNMRKVCKCHGVSGSCQMNTCWTSLPDMNRVGNHIRHQYRHAAKVGAMSAKESNVDNLNKELSAIKPDKLVFADSSQDYCYAVPDLGINGTLGRYCSKAKHRPDGAEVSRAEKDSCDRLCTRCGYKVMKERVKTERQCDCRFVYCCSIECKRCPHVEETYKCARHS